MKLRFTVGFILVAAWVAWAQPAGAATMSGVQAAQPQPPEARAGMSAGELQRVFDAYALVQAQDALQLSDSQYEKFVPRFKALQETRRRNQQARVQLLLELRRLTNQQQSPTLDEAAVRDRLKGLRDLDERASGELRKAYDGIDELLDVRQQARFRLFEEQIERRKLDLLMRARQNVRRGRGGD